MSDGKKKPPKTGKQDSSSTDSNEQDAENAKPEEAKKTEENDKANINSSQNETQADKSEKTKLGDPSKTDEPKTSLDIIIEALASLNFLADAQTEVRVSGPEDLKKLLSTSDEVPLTERDSFPMFYNVWEDVPNRRYYIIRNSQRFISFTSFEEMVDSLLTLLGKRMDEASSFIREPETVYLRSSRVYTPNSLGFPTEHILSNSMTTEVFRTRLEDVCAPIRVEAGVIRVRVLGDRGIIQSNLNLMTYSMSSMSHVRTERENYMNEIARLTRRERMTLNPRNGFEFYLPSFDFNVIQGPFDIFKKAPRLRLLFLQTVVTPHIFYTPLPTTEIMKHASVNATKTGFVMDIAARSFKPDYNEMYTAYILSMLCPGEIIFDIDFTAVSDLSTPIKGFAALIARMIFLFDESSQFSNTTVEAQIAIDNAIINWGLEMNVLIPNGATTSSKYPLNGYRLSRATAGEQTQFNFLKITSGSGGACGNGNLYPKTSERLRDFYPNIAVRSNYVVDCDDISAYRNGLHNKHGWRVMQGVDVFVNKMSNASGYRGIIQILSTRLFEFFIRLNEYSKVHWYSIFRCTLTTSRLFTADMMQKRSVRMTITPDFLLAVPKGFDNNEWVPMMIHINKMRFESSFVRETNRVAYFYRYARHIFERTGALRSYPKRRLIALACEKSEIFNFIRGYLYYSDEDKLIPRLLDSCSSDEGLLGAYKPLLRIDVPFLHMYGMLNSALVSCRLNPRGEIAIKNCIATKSIMTNRSDLAPAISYNYTGIEALIRQKSFHSVFVGSASDPFKLNIILPYTIIHKISEVRNDSCIQRIPSDLRDDVSYDKSVKNEKIGLLLSSVDPRDYVFPDDYASSSYVIDLYSIDGCEYDDIVMSAEQFYSNISSRIAETAALTKKDYKFISLYDNTKRL